MSVSAMTEMASAIREVLQRYGYRLNEIAEDDLHDFAMIVAAFAADLQREEARRVGAC